MRGIVRWLGVAGLAVVVVAGTGLTVQGKSGQSYSAGHLDPAFGTEGMATSPALRGGQIQQIAVQVVNGEDRVVAVGQSGTAYWTVARFLPSGTLDTTFGTNGIVTRPYSKAYSSAYRVLVQPDQKILVFGTIPTGLRNSNVFVVTRYQPDGKSYDTSFGLGGTVTITPPAGSRPFRGGMESALALQGDKVLVALSSDSDGDPYTAPFLDLHVVRIDSAGRFDNSFGPDPNTAFATFTGAGRPGAMLVQGVPVSETVIEQRIVLAMHTVFSYHDPTQPYYVTSVRRLTPNGAPDMSFAQSGIADMVVPGATETLYMDIALDAGNRIVAAGVWDVVLYDEQGAAIGAEHHRLMARYWPDGSLDATFALGGVLRQDWLDSSFRFVAIQPDGKILANVLEYDANHHPVGSRPWRFTDAGLLDGTFGVGGSAVSSMPWNLYGGLVLVRRPEDGWGTRAFIVGGTIRVAVTAKGRQTTTSQWALWRYFY